MRLLLLILAVPALFAGDAAPFQWLGGAAGTRSDRQAVVIAADRYQLADWDLPTLANNVDAIRRGLSAAGFPDGAVRVLAGRDVNADGVRAAVRAAATALTGETPSLLVYYTGHGHTAADGAPALCTHYTQEGAQGGLEGTIPVPELAEWVAGALDQAGLGGKAGAVLVIDACRNRRMLAPPPQARLRPASVWQWFSTDDGRYAQAPPEGAASPFTAALAESLAALAVAGEAAGPQRLAEQVRVRLQERKAPQLPRLEAPPAGAVEPLLARRPVEVGFALAAVDAASGILLDGRAIAALDGAAVADARRLRAVPGRHRLRVTAPGWRTAEGEFQLPNESDGTLRVALTPWLTLSRDRHGEVATLAVGGVEVRFRRLPAATTTVGSPPGQPGRKPTEEQRPVAVGPCWLAENEATQDLWQEVLGQPAPARFKGPRKPVESVTFTDIQRFCAALEARCPGLQPRLPTEAEWEFACRAGTTTAWSFGDDPAQLHRHANYADKRLADLDPDQYPGADPDHDDGVGEGTAPVGRYPANPWGLLDLHGNIAELCADPWRASPGQPPADDPAPAHAVRGGSWLSTAVDTRSAARVPLPATAATPAVGFRLVVASPLPAEP